VRNPDSPRKREYLLGVLAEDLGLLEVPRAAILSLAAGRVELQYLGHGLHQVFKAASSRPPARGGRPRMTLDDLFVQAGSPDRLP